MIQLRVPFVRLLAAGLFLLTLPSLAVEGHAQSPSSQEPCLEGRIGQIERLIEATYERYQGIPITHVDLVGDRLQVFLAALNRTSPSSRFIADRAIVFLSPADANAIIMFGQNNCVSKIANVPVMDTLFWMRGRVVNTSYPFRDRNPLGKQEIDGIRQQSPIHQETVDPLTNIIRDLSADRKNL